MMLQGEVLFLINRQSYYKVVIGVETGYNVDLYTTRIKDFLIIKDLLVGDKVLFTGYTISKEGSTQFHLDSIVKRTFDSCLECELPLTSNQCIIQHDKEAQKLEGEWTVVHKRESDGNIKIFFEQHHFVFAAVSTATHWYHILFADLQDGDIVTVKGWRYKQRTSIKLIDKLE